MTRAAVRRAMGLFALAAGLAACAASAERKWEKAGAGPAALEKDEAECLTAAGLERAPRVYAGTAGDLGRDADNSGRGDAAYVSCMEARGYTRPAR